MKNKTIKRIGNIGIALLLTGCFFMIISMFLFEGYLLGIMLFIGIGILIIGWRLCWFVSKKMKRVVEGDESTKEMKT